MKERKLKLAAVVCAIIAAIVLTALFTVQNTVRAEGITVVSETGDRIGIFEDIKVDGTSGGNIVVLFGNADIKGEVSGDVAAIFGDARVDAKVAGSVVSVFGTVTLSDMAEVGGDIVALGSVSKAPGARVTGQEVQIYGEQLHFGPQLIYYARLVGTVLFSLLVLVAGSIMIVVSGDSLKFKFENIQHGVGRKLAMGFLGLLGATILLLLLFITIVAPVLYLILLVASAIAASIFTGRLVLIASYPDNSLYSEFFTGLAIITLLKALIVFAIPRELVLLDIILSIILWAAVNSLGFGVLVESRFSKIHQK